MKKVFETIKDILYDSLDYVIMLAILIVVIGVIGWRLDVLFAKDAFDVPTSIDEVVVDNSGREPKAEVDIENPTGEEEPVDPLPEVESPDTPLIPVVEPPVIVAPPVVAPPVVAPPVKPAVEGKMVKVSIPAGSLPGKIGSILESNQLINSSRDFIAKAVELKLDTKLKSGNFQIASGSSIEQILKVITK